MLREIGDKMSESICLRELANFHNYKNNKEKAISFYMESLEISILIGDKVNEVKTLNSWGTSYKGYENIKEKINCLDKAVIISQEISNQHLEAVSYGNLANAYNELGVIQLALKYYELSYDIFHSLHGESNALTIQSKKNIAMIKSSFNGYRQ